MNPTPPNGWYSRGYLPHFDIPGLYQAVTTRLADSLPTNVVKSLVEELRFVPEEQRESEKIRKLNQLLDASHGSCLLRQPDNAAAVQKALLFGHGSHYNLFAWVVMPNHVHTLIQPFEGRPLWKIVAMWKKWTAREIIRSEGRRGQLWYREYFDRYQRDEQHFRNTIAYIENNPVKVQLCETTSDWRWSSARFRSLDGPIDWELLAATFGFPKGHSGEWRSTEGPL